MEGKSGKAEEKRRMSKVTLRGLAGFKVLWVFSVIFLVVATGCHTHRPPPPPEDHYDPRNISRTEDNSYGPSIAVGPNGEVYVAWMEAKGLFFRYRDLNGNWSEIETLATKNWAPHLACDPFGNVHLVWEEHDPDFEHSKIYYRMRKPSGEWTGIEVLATGGADQPRIAVDPSGTVHVVWNSENAGGMQYRKKSPGGTWSQIETGPAYITNPSIAADKEGGLHIVFEQLNEEIAYLYRSPTGTWSEPVNVSKSPSWYSWVPSVAVNSSGLVFVNWVERGERAMYFTKKEQGGNWSIPDSVPNIPGYPWTNCVHFDSQGTLHLVWQENRGAPYDIYRKSFKNNLWGSEENVSQTSGESFAPDFAIGPEGLYVVWSEKEEAETGYNWEIYFLVINL